MSLDVAWYWQTEHGRPVLVCYEVTCCEVMCEVRANMKRGVFVRPRGMLEPCIPVHVMRLALMAQDHPEIVKPGQLAFEAVV